MKKAISLGVAAAMAATLLAGCGTAKGTADALSYMSQQRRCFQRGRKHCRQHHCRVYCYFRSRSQRGP